MDNNLKKMTQEEFEEVLSALSEVDGRSIYVVRKIASKDFFAVVKDNKGYQQFDMDQMYQNYVEGKLSISEVYNTICSKTQPNASQSQPAAQQETPQQPDISITNADMEAMLRNVENSTPSAPKPAYTSPIAQFESELDDAIKESEDVLKGKTASAPAAPVISAPEPAGNPLEGLESALDDDVLEDQAVQSESTSETQASTSQTSETQPTYEAPNFATMLDDDEMTEDDLEDADEDTEDNAAAANLAGVTSSTTSAEESDIDNYEEHCDGNCSGRTCGYDCDNCDDKYCLCRECRRWDDEEDEDDDEDEDDYNEDDEEDEDEDGSNSGSPEMLFASALNGLMAKASVDEDDPPKKLDIPDVSDMKPRDIMKIMMHLPDDGDDEVGSSEERFEL